ncbi:cob(I)yrinic acid a,c-diamide adenosyltransferase [Irregularibacter muris]|uniref:Corrinoid adenosyltransferase n=1 Tax=Irregularibacter muris TaxID=1796619 RepID=A0AAE3HF99_9FIRM|nr:cob(I)yrinic acid a,c-diamide adenosyltransferase [Irregularibacter muris]MCR1898389.1 cob(I)yrinic acid a,c-diamide adenosyltransferase [Irregularibacter muris]
MSKVYTRTGDKGDTSLFGGARVKKSSQRVHAYGAVDQANSAIGIAVNYLTHKTLIKVVRTIQEKLFVVGGELASDPKGIERLRVRIQAEDVKFLEGIVDEIAKSLEDKNYFVLPGKTKASAFLHSARTQVRFAEREIITLMEEEEVNLCILEFINRLSDVLYVLSRYEDEVVPCLEDPGERKTLNTKRVDVIMETCIQKAKEIKVPMVITVVDAGGNILQLRRMDGAILGSIDIAQNKAFTALAFQAPTEDLGKKSQPGQELYGLETTNQGKVVTFAGGIPLKIQGRIVGALGVSGGTVEEDKIVCLAGSKILRE